MTYNHHTIFEIDAELPSGCLVFDFSFSMGGKVAIQAENAGPCGSAFSVVSDEDGD